MENKFTRNQQQHNVYKAKLKQESKDVYNIEKCWASHKPYKGLIASHIKPYKLCVLDNDSYSEYNINNGLLLSKAIDDYFDKLLITFGEDGKIICSDKVEEEIRDEFASYQLDEVIFNEERKNYMRIHRCLFYYKHYYNQSDIPANLRLSNMKIPFFNCGIKHYENNFIIFDNSFWYLCPTTKLKQEFISRTNYKFKYYISNADLANVLLSMEEYAVNCKITPFLNTPNSTINVEYPKEIIRENTFKISSTNYNVSDFTPNKFINFLNNIFANDVEVQKFRTIVNLALRGKGFTKGVALFGDTQNIDLLILMLKEILGTYIIDYKDTKILYKKSIPQSIPNCCIMLFSNHNLPIEQYNWNKIIDNSCFSSSIVNINQYIPFVTANSAKNLNLQNCIKFKVNSMTTQFNINEILEEENGAILNWFINDIELSLKDFETIVKEHKLISNDTTINNWLYTNCEFGENIKNEEKAKDLYNNYINFATNNNFMPVTERYFYLQIGDIFQKKRYSFGIVYLGIKLKNIV